MSKEVIIHFKGRSLWTAKEFRLGIEAIKKDGYPKYRGDKHMKQRRVDVECFGRWMDKATIIGLNSRNHKVEVEVEGLKLGKVLGALFEKYPQIKNYSKSSLVFSREKE